MGTNYYARPIPTADDYIRLVGAVYIKDADAFEIFEQVSRVIRPFQREYHIGKSSVGWRFCFDHGDWEHFKDIPSMKEWLKGMQIVDEYNVYCTNEEFWNMVESRQDQKHSHYNDIIDGYDVSTSTDFC